MPGGSRLGLIPAGRAGRPVSETGWLPGPANLFQGRTTMTNETLAIALPKAAVWVRDAIRADRANAYGLDAP